MIFSLNDTCALLNSVQKFIEMEGWLLLKFFICLHMFTYVYICFQLSSFNCIIVLESEKHDSQIDSKNEWLLLSVTFTAKFRLVFV